MCPFLLDQINYDIPVNGSIRDIARYGFDWGISFGCNANTCTSPGYHLYTIMCDQNNNNCVDQYDTGTDTQVVGSGVSQPTCWDNDHVTLSRGFVWYNNYSGLCGIGDVTAGSLYGPVPPSPPSKISPTFLSLPLAKYTPYNAEVSAIMDHSMTSSYAKNSTIVAFNGEIGDVGNGCFCYSTNSSCDSSNYASCAVAGFRNAEHSNFLSGVINYIGSYLYYNGHPGYDYPVPANTPIYAAADGVAHLPSSFPGYADAKRYNTIEIDHQNGYKTYYLHLSSQNVTENQPVIRGTTIIGYSGDKGSTGSFHLHFEVQKQVNGNGIPVDPYGWQGAGLDPYLRATNEELWIPPPISVGANSAFTSIQGAYDSVTKNGQSLLLQEQAFPEYLVFSKNLTVKLQGGYDPNYQTKSGWTIINGSLTINSGSVEVDGICIQK